MSMYTHMRQNPATLDMLLVRHVAGIRQHCQNYATLCVRAYSLPQGHTVIALGTPN